MCYDYAPPLGRLKVNVVTCRGPDSDHLEVRKRLEKVFRYIAPAYNHDVRSLHSLFQFFFGAWRITENLQLSHPVKLLDVAVFQVNVVYYN
jgi:hypothetical protein